MLDPICPEERNCRADRKNRTNDQEGRPGEALPNRAVDYLEDAPPATPTVLNDSVLGSTNGTVERDTSLLAGPASGVGGMDILSMKPGKSNPSQ